MDQLKRYWESFFKEEDKETVWTRKKQLWEDRNGRIVRIKGNGKIFERMNYKQGSELRYLLHLFYLIKQGDRFHIEEEVIPYKLQMKGDKIVSHEQEKIEKALQAEKLEWPREQDREEYRFSYDRRAAVQYAERWWNSYNPAYRRFDDDCTNYISQCLRAGGAPMWGSPNRERGWWYGGDHWSFSWSVAHSMRWYLSGSTQGLQGKEVASPTELTYGDVICYDFEGDGRWDHTTIVTAKDAYGMPLVNAHTNSSRHRYWSYEDSLAWTENIQYKFFRIGEK